MADALFVPDQRQGADSPAAPGIQPHRDDLVVTEPDRHSVALDAQVLGKNQLIAGRNRRWLANRRTFALNLVNSPGAGTTTLERTLLDFKDEIAIGVVEGDQATSNDAVHIPAIGVRAVQVNTGTGCHLEADMLERAILRLEPKHGSLLLVENVGNLVCPALFDLSESAKVVTFSVTEGEDKPLKYPHMFAAADGALLSKVDLLPHLRVDPDCAVANALALNAALQLFAVSAYSGAGLQPRYAWLRAGLTARAATEA